MPSGFWSPKHPVFTSVSQLVSVPVNVQRSKRIKHYSNSGLAPQDLSRTSLLCLKNTSLFTYAPVALIVASVTAGHSVAHPANNLASIKIFT